MPLNFASMLLSPTPVTPWNFGGVESSTARQQLELSRKRFEWEQKKAEEGRETARIAARAKEAAAELARQQARETAEAKAAAKLLEKQQTARLDFSKAAAEGNVEATQAMSPYLESLGLGVDQLGQVGGMPTYRVYDRAQEAAAESKAWEKRPRALEGWDGEESATGSLARMEGLGYPTNERGSLDTAPLTGSGQVGEDGRSVSDRYLDVLDAGGAPTRGPDEEDFMGAVPRDVIDMGAMRAQTLARLSRALGALSSGYHDEVDRESAARTEEGVLRAGLPMEKSLALYHKAREAPDEMRRAEMMANAQTERFRETRDQLTEKDKSAMRKEGRAAAEQRAKDDDVAGGVKALRVIDEMEDLLDDKNKENDTMIAGALMSIQDVKGIPSDKDLAFAFGMGKADAITQVFSKVQELAVGGFSDAQREAIRSFITRVGQSQREKLDTYLETGNLLGEMNEFEQEGYRGYSKRLVPGHVYNDWLDKQPKKEKKPEGGAAGGADYDQALDTQARAAGYDPDKIRAVTRHESGDKGDAKSVAGAAGVFQLMGDRAREVGTSPEDLLEMTPAEQVPYGIRYLKNTGLRGDAPARDYALAFAAPGYIGKSDDTEIKQYKKGTKRGDQVREQNPGWVPKDGGDITVGSILDFYGLRGVTDAPKKAGAKEGAAKPASAEPDAAKRMRAILERSR